MINCSFHDLVLLLDRKLDLDKQLEVLEHLDRCSICRDAVYQITRDRKTGTSHTFPIFAA
ncbi:MAG: hypothetical protein QM330_09560 [Acidobacteriota bacterium]|jgi:predicted anti-sigma-YlaC factor YlaD|nr:hypothetical protein [Acidobacteriota bacterium]NLT33513.1 hypothetical protein [Acidobacteriota bacterium]